MATFNPNAVRLPVSGGDSQRPEYPSWRNMWIRCTEPTYREFHFYGGRGIKVAAEWIDFRQFFADIGPKPSPTHTIDRIDNDGNYEPGNVRWATPKEQSNNRRRRTSYPHGFGGGRPGEGNPNARFNNEAVRVIRFLRARGVARKRLAAAYSTTGSRISSITSRKSWRNT